MIRKYLSGTTPTITWISSGVTPTSIYAAIFNGDETLISSVSMTSSGNGHYYAAQTMPTTPGFYIAETKATLSNKPYINRKTIQIVLDEAD